MIFVCTGSRNYQFNRLIREVDRLAGAGKLKDDVFAQIGETDYVPRFLSYRDYIDVDAYERYQDQCDILITHGGTGSIVQALKRGKNVIAVPRLKKYGEHIDDHQIQIVREYEKREQIKGVWSIDGLWDAIAFFQNGNRLKAYCQENMLFQIVEEYIREHVGGTE